MAACMRCGASLTGEDIGAHKKLINRGATAFLCIDCLAEKAGGASAERLKELGEPLRLLVSKAEADIQPDLDGMHFNSIMVDFLERT